MICIWRRFSWPWIYPPTHPVTVTNEDSYKFSTENMFILVATVTRWGVDPTYTCKKKLIDKKVVGKNQRNDYVKSGTYTPENLIFRTSNTKMEVNGRCFPFSIALILRFKTFNFQGCKHNTRFRRWTFWVLFWMFSNKILIPSRWIKTRSETQKMNIDLQTSSNIMSE